MDLRCAGHDRFRLLADFAQTGQLLSLTLEGKLVAYAAVRPGRGSAQTGPIVADSRADFAEILKHVSLRSRDHEVVCDVLNVDAEEGLLAHGLSPRRYLKRMTAPWREDCLCGEGIWCGTGFEWG